MSHYHVPVLLEETIRFLGCRPGGVYVDCTVGGGGHAEGILRRSEPDGRLVGIDRDPEAIEASRRRLEPFGDRVTLIRADFARIREILVGLGLGAVDGILFDLGVSSYQLEQVERGFAYRHDAPLDMRMDPGEGPSAADLVNKLPEAELAGIIARFGEERWAARIARFLVESRERAPLVTTGQLVEVVKRAIPAAARRGGPHPARRTFQALRIAVNRELDRLEEGLRGAVEMVKPGGRICVISFHSLEDRAVKDFFRRLKTGCSCPPRVPVCRCGRPGVLEVLTRKPVRPAPAEVEVNPRCRSARLRAAQKVLKERENEYLGSGA